VNIGEEERTVIVEPLDVPVELPEEEEVPAGR